MTHILARPGIHLALAFALLAPVPLWAGTAFWVPIYDGLTWTYLESGQYENSEGEAYTWGPELMVARVDAVDEQVIDHHADFTLRGDFYLQDADGVSKISDGDPRLPSSSYRYYIDPEPLFMTAPLNLGETRAFVGAVRGHDEFNVVDWTGTWHTAFTYLGKEEVVTPLGTFMADKFEVDSELTAAVTGSTVRFRDYWTENWWLADGTFAAKVAGEGGGTTDYDGDSVVDRWYKEQLTMVAANVPEASTAHLAAAGLSVVALLRRVGRA